MNKIILTVVFIFTITAVLIVTNKINLENKQKNLKPEYFSATEISTHVSKLVNITINPNYNYNFSIMKKGVLQHLDRKYTYDVIPEKLLGGLLFQGIHRPRKNTTIKLEILSPMIIYFFFHHKVDGGYSKIFSSLDNWILCNKAPQYDINNGDHGLKMIMYSRTVKKGIYYIPKTTKDRACFSIVFKPL